MSKTIFKYKLEIKDHQTLEMPANAELLCVQVQNNDIYLWALVNMNMPPRDIIIAVYGTGNPINGEFGNYIGTCQLNGFVWHVCSF
jgi:hypothetical protein